MKTERQVIADILQCCNEHLHPDVRWMEEKYQSELEGQEFLAEEIIDLIPDGMVESIKRDAGV